MSVLAELREIETMSGVPAMDRIRDVSGRAIDKIERLQIDAARWQWFMRTMPQAASVPMRMMPPDAVLLARSKT